MGVKTTDLSQPTKKSAAKGAAKGAGPRGNPRKSSARKSSARKSSARRPALVRMTAADAAALVERGEDGTDWARLATQTDDDIRRAIAEDPDAAPELDDEWFAAARAAAARTEGKQPISFRVDPDILEFFRAQGPGYQKRMHAVLRAYVARQRQRAGE
jgi:uncharacterized protein (DUF4415 family)